MILLDPELEPEPAPQARGTSPRALTRFLAQAQSAIGLRGQVTVLLTTDAAIRDLNKRFRGKDAATDVLSFPSTNPTASPERIAGDIAISAETAGKQAAEHRHSHAVELRVLILHGLLHLAGFDHESDNGKMERHERKLRAALGLPQGLIERAAIARNKTERAGTKRTKAARRKP